MNKVIIGAIIGVAAGYAVSKMNNKGQFDHMGENLNKMTSKAKKKIKDVMDSGKNQVEYLGDRIGFEAGRDKM